MGAITIKVMASLWFNRLTLPQKIINRKSKLLKPKIGNNVSFLTIIFKYGR